MRRYAELDVFRGIAIISVLLFHYTTRFDQIYGHDEMLFDFSYGYLGVQLFFMLSGFVIVMSLETIDNSYEFVIKRVSRLYPAYWTAIIVTYLLVSFFKLPGREASLFDALFNFTMLQNWFRGIDHVDGAYWALSRFISFYCIMFILHKLNLISKMVQICFVWLAVICSAEVMLKFGLILPNEIQITMLQQEGSFFILGIMFYMLKENGYNLGRFLVVVCSLLTILFVNHLAVFVSAVAFSIIFVLVTKGYLRFIILKPLVWLGTVSYSLYLLHQNIGYIIIQKLYALNLNFFLIIIIPTIVSLLLAAGVTYFLERPMVRLVKTNALKAFAVTK